MSHPWWLDPPSSRTQLLSRSSCQQNARPSRPPALHPCHRSCTSACSTPRCNWAWCRCSGCPRSTRRPSRSCRAPCHWPAGSPPPAGRSCWASWGASTSRWGGALAAEVYTASFPYQRTEGWIEVFCFPSRGKQLLLDYHYLVR